MHASLTVIAPTRGWAPVRLRELWQYRQVLYFLIWRDIKVRYRQTLIGAAWAIIQPMMTMIVFTIFFGRLARMPSDGMPYALFSFAALVPWAFFANGLTQGTNSLIASGHIITKVYFPRLLIPCARVLAGLPDLMVAFAVLLGMMVWYRVPFRPLALLFIPALVVLMLATGIGVASWLSAMSVKYRDVQHVIPFLVQVWLFITPIAYPSSLVPDRWRVVYALNPMAGVVEGFRWALLGQAPGLVLWPSILTAVLVLVGGAFMFRRLERSFADVI